LRRKTIIVIDGQGGGIGGAIIKELKKVLGESVELIALGTNSMATAAMLSSGANKGATGENAIVFNCAKADYIVGSINIILVNSMMGELTEKMAVAISSSPAKKILLPVTQEQIDIVGLKKEPLPHIVKELAEKLKLLEDKNYV
jgi:hypothetical protein